MFLRKGSRSSFYVYGLVFLFISINQQLYPFLPELQDTQWSPPQTIPLYIPETLPPILVADQNRTVHAFSSQWIGDESSESFRAIVYNRWTLGQGWTTPIDIILSPDKEARVTDVYLDREGIFHVIFFGGDHTSANIYYSKSPAALADNSRAWSAPLIIGENASDPESAVFAEDNQGTLQVIYYGRELGSGLYVVNSSDGGENWSNSTPLFNTQNDEPNISLLHVSKGDSGWLHAVWGVYSIEGQGRGIYYARLKDGNEWSEPVLLADAQDGLGTQTPTIIEYKETLIALYNMPPKIVMRRSGDNGKTWDDPSIIFPRHVGVNGSLSLVIDANNELHLFFGQRIPGSPDIHGLWHSILINNRWTEPGAVIKGPRVVDKEGLKGFDPYDARAVVSQGNVILVAWRTDPGDIKDNGIWFSYAVINAPELPVVTLQPFVKNNITPSPSALPVPTLSTNDTRQISFDKDRQVHNPLGWLVTVVIVTGILGVVYIIFKRAR